MIIESNSSCKLTGVIAPKAMDVRHPRIIQLISGRLSLRILKTNG
jgi:hypothetical protein